MSRRVGFGAFFPLLLFIASLGAAPSKAQSGFSPKAAAPVGKGEIPKVKTSDPYVVHSHHSFYFQDTLAAVLLKFTTSRGFNAKDPACVNDLGYIYYYFGQYSDAQEQFQKALDMNPLFVDALINLGVNALKAGDNTAALNYLDKAYQMDPSKGEIAYDLGLLSYEQNDLNRATAFFQEASQKSPDDPKVWNNLGCALFKQGNYAKAYESFKGAVGHGASFYHAYYNRAVASILSGHYEEALEDTQKAVQLAPGNSDALNLLGLACLFNQNYLRASVALAQAVKKDGNNPGYLNNLGRAQLGLGHYRDAEKLIQRALLFDPGLKPALWNMGDLKLRQGKAKEALNLYENVADWEEARQSAVFQYNWGVACYKTKEAGRAGKIWETARGLDPQYVEPLYGLAVLNEESRNFDKASSLTRQGQVLEPESSRWVRLQGDLDMAQGRTQEALGAYEKARQMGQKDAELLEHIESLKSQAPENPSTPVREGAGGGNLHAQIVHLGETGNLDGALALARKAADQNAADPTAWEDLSDAYLKMDQRKEALESMEKALRLSPQNGHYLEECGHIAYLNEKILIAENYFERAAKAPLSTYQTYLGLGACYYRQNYFDEAIGYWSKGSLANPKMPEFYYNLGRAYYQKGSPAQAALYFRKALQLRPKYPEVITNLAAMDMDAGRLREAGQKLKQSLEMDPRMAETYFNFGNLGLKTGDFDGALKYYQKGLEINPDDANGYYYQGVAFLKQDQWARAQSLLEKTLEKDPAHADALYNLGKVAVELGDYSAAQRYFEESLKYKPGQDDAYFGMGLVHYHQGQYKEAQLDFVKAQTGYRVAHEATYYLGQTEEKLGDPASAEAFYRQSIQLQPGFGLPHLALGDLLKQKGRLMEARTEYQKAALQREYPAVSQAAEQRMGELQ
ncbi:MAG TPA: tetratricopeptide repeat protein [bacterium]|nr:tetratricopeptide repeat protein [bacterium]